jgi:transposase InsO family protein
MCELTKVSQAGYYRFLHGASVQPEVVELRHQIQQIALQWPAYGSRRITAELQRRGWLVNRKPVQRLMREDNLLCLRKRRFVVTTTDSQHGMPVYPNRAASMTLNGCDQLWLADITYIRLAFEFVYLAVILDAYSRRVIGWALERTLEDRLSLAALQMALSRRQVRGGLVHHSDRGVQYASLDYTGELRAQGIAISMSRRGNPYDNAACESFMKTLKYEEVYRSEYLDLEDARARIGTFLEHIYNEERLHSALHYRPPAEFERLHPTPVTVTPSTIPPEEA